MDFIPLILYDEKWGYNIEDVKKLIKILLSLL